MTSAPYGDEVKFAPERLLQVEELRQVPHRFPLDTETGLKFQCDVIDLGMIAKKVTPAVPIGLRHRIQMWNHAKAR